MRKFNKREKARIRNLNELVTDSTAMFNECVLLLTEYRQQAGELLLYIELRALHPMDEQDYMDYSDLFSKLRSIEHKMSAVQAEVAGLETQFTQFTRQYTRLINHLEHTGDKGVSKIFAQMEELALDLLTLSYNTKADVDLHYSLFYDFRLKMRAILFN
jgi:hypothetical protein